MKDMQVQRTKYVKIVGFLNFRWKKGPNGLKKKKKNHRGLGLVAELGVWSDFFQVRVSAQRTNVI